MIKKYKNLHEIFEHFGDPVYNTYAMNNEDVSIEIGIIFTEYEIGKIDFEDAFARLKGYLDSKGDVTPFLTAVNITRNWER